MFACIKLEIAVYLSIHIIIMYNEAWYRLDNIHCTVSRTENNLIHDISDDSWRRPIDIRYSKAADSYGDNHIRCHSPSGKSRITNFYAMICVIDMIAITFYLLSALILFRTEICTENLRVNDLQFYSIVKSHWDNVGTTYIELSNVVRNKVTNCDTRLLRFGALCFHLI